MSGSFPRFRLYNETGTTLIYEFDCVTNWGDGPFLDPIKSIVHDSLRGQGDIITEGSDAAWDFAMEFILFGDDYADLVAQMQAVSTTVQKNVKYLLKIDLTVSTTYNLKVKRITSVVYPISGNKKVVNSQKGTITFHVNCWA